MRINKVFSLLFKSLSSDTSQDSSSSSSAFSSPYRLSEPRLNLQLFKQFTQSRMPSAAAPPSSSDSKTAPCSPLTSPDNRSFFKVSEVEAKIEDTKRRLSEAISEPLQLLSKIMDEKSSYRPKALSASATELSSAAAVGINGHAESNNNNYCIKEEEGGADSEEENSGGPAGGAADESPVLLSLDTRSPVKSPSISASLDKCSMSALARQDDEDFCILYSEDFETCASDTSASASAATATPGGRTGRRASCSTELSSEDESEWAEPPPAVPHYTLTVLTLLVYGYLVLPLPSYIGGMLLGIGLGFLLAIAAVWLTGPATSGVGSRRSQHITKMCTLTKLDIKEPELYKVGEFSVCVCVYGTAAKRKHAN